MKRLLVTILIVLQFLWRPLDSRCTWRTRRAAAANVEHMTLSRTWISPICRTQSFHGSRWRKDCLRGVPAIGDAIKGSVVLVHGSSRQ